MARSKCGLIKQCSLDKHQNRLFVYVLNLIHLWGIASQYAPEWLSLNGVGYDAKANEAFCSRPMNLVTGFKNTPMPKYLINTGLSSTKTVLVESNSWISGRYGFSRKFTVYTVVATAFPTRCFYLSTAIIRLQIFVDAENPAEIRCISGCLTVC